MNYPGSSEKSVMKCVCNSDKNLFMEIISQYLPGVRCFSLILFILENIYSALIEFLVTGKKSYLFYVYVRNHNNNKWIFCVCKYPL